MGPAAGSRECESCGVDTFGEEGICLFLAHLSHGPGSPVADRPTLPGSESHTGLPDCRLVTFPGPTALGRGIVLLPGQAVPVEFADVWSVDITTETVGEPGRVVDELHGRWAARDPFVVLLHVEPAALQVRPVTDRVPWELGPRFEFPIERLAFLVWANTYDLRAGTPIWWHASKARHLGMVPGGPCDAETPEGHDVWIDGGPRGRVDVEGAVVHRESLELGIVPGPVVDRETTDDLAPDQIRAVLHPFGPARIIAPAGSGKTRVLTSRLRHLLANEGVEARLVTAVAYNARAAAELQERLGDVGASVRTIHSLGLSILNRASRVTVIEESEVRRLLDSIVPVRPQRNQDVMAPYLEALQAIRIGLRDPAEIEVERDDVPGLPEVFEEYHGLLHRRGLVDFDEQIYGAIEVLLADPAARDTARATARHLLVDEFQDLTPAYLLLLRLIALPGLQVFGVGDDDQVIYGYAGADPGYLIDFADLFPGAAEHALEVNYRCPPDVVAAASSLLGNNQRRIAKEITARPGRHETAQDLTVVEAGAEGAAAAAGQIVAEWLDSGVSPSDVAVLARVNDALLPVHAALFEAGVPVRSTLGPGLLERSGVRTALAYLRVGLDPGDIRRDDLMEVVRRPSRRLAKATTAHLRRHRRWALGDLADLAATNEGKDARRFSEFIADLGLLGSAGSDGADAGRLLQLVRDEVGLGSTMGMLDGWRSAADRSSHVDDLDALIATAAVRPEPHGFQRWLTEVLSAPDQPGGVTLSSVHRVKGREWPRVLVFRADESLMPHRLADDIEEERRVFHVALTRGSERVAVVSGERPSRFVDEMLGRVPRFVEPPRGLAAPRSPKRAPVLPRVGSIVAWSGHTGTVAEIDGGSLVLTLDSGATLRVSAGERLQVLSEAPTTPADEALFEALREWRLRTATAQGVPAYVVFNDRSLRDIAARRPDGPRALLDCEGVGPVKLERYGDDVFEIIEEHAPSG